MNLPTTRAAVLALLLLPLAGCASLRPYVPQQVEPAAMVNAAPETVNSQPLDLRWWDQFEDPVLISLVDQALDANRDVRAAVARVDQARAMFDEAGLDRLPHVPLSASVDRRDQAQPGFSDQPQTVSTYRLGFDAYWEIDVFGRL